jgi:hypothetical protein
VLVMSRATAGVPSAVYHCARPSNSNFVVFRRNQLCLASLWKRQSTCRWDGVLNENTMCTPWGRCADAKHTVSVHYHALYVLYAQDAGGGFRTQYLRPHGIYFS